jgi:hypothetical protein
MITEESKINILVNITEIKIIIAKAQTGKQKNLQLRLQVSIL